MQARAAEGAAKAEVSRLRGERDEAVRQAADLRQRHNHALHELRRREQDFARLQAHLRDLLSERARACLPAPSLSGSHCICGLLPIASAATLMPGHPTADCKTRYCIVLLS